MRRPTLVLLFLASLAAVAPGCRDEMQEPRAAIEPSPALAPDQVVRSILNALQHNDERGPDSGIVIAFGFASPEQQSQSVDRFASFVKREPFAMILGHREAQFGPMSLRGERAEQLVNVTSSDGRTLPFHFSLTLQQEGPYDGCWLVDTVLPMGMRPPMAQRERATPRGPQDRGHGPGPGPGQRERDADRPERPRLPVA